jgi:dephospho-CoA kinase
MLIVGLTGGIGSGKSVIAVIFQVLGVPVFQADPEAKKCYSEPDVISEVLKKFGPEVINGNQVDTKALAKIVFSDVHALASLNAIIHPRVLRAYEDWGRQYLKLPYIIMESAIIFEAGLVQRFDHIISVFAPEELCMKRIMQRDGVTHEQVESRLKAQIDPQEKIKNSDFVIYNDDKQLVVPQVLEIHKTISGIKN